MISEDSQVKLLIAAVGIVSGLIGSGVSLFLFFWKESRDRFHRQMGDLRTFLIMTEVIRLDMRLNRGQKSELKPDWFVEHSGSIMHKEEWFNLAQELIRLTLKAQGAVDAEGRSAIVEDLESLKLKIELAIKDHSHSLKRGVLWV